MTFFIFLPKEQSKPELFLNFHKSPKRFWKGCSGKGIRPWENSVIYSKNIQNHTRILHKNYSLKLTKMPVIKRWRQERMIDDMEELFGAEMQPYLSNFIEEDVMDVQENNLDKQVPDPHLTVANSNTRFWSKLTTLFHSENW